MWLQFCAELQMMFEIKKSIVLYFSQSFAGEEHSMNMR